MILVVAGLTAFAAAFVLTPVVRAFALRRGFLDMPNERSSHSRPTPRNGGYAIGAGIALALLASGVFRDETLTGIAAGIVVLIVMALIDEQRHVHQLARLAIQLAVAAGVSLVGGLRIDSLTLPAMDPIALGALAVPVTVFWLAGVTNAYNFMDGLNGIASLEAMVCSATFGVLLTRAGDIPAAAFAVAAGAAAASFLPFNLTGTIFMGDTGSTTLGLAFAALAVRSSMDGVPFVAAALPLSPFLFDTAATLVRRIARGERFLSAHRSHFYQRLNQQGWSHPAVSLLWALLGAAAGVVSVWYPALSDAQRVAALAMIVALHAIVFSAIAVRAYTRGAAA